MENTRSSLKGFVDKNAVINPCMQNSLKKLKIFQAVPAIGASQPKKEKLKPILKHSAIPSVCAIGASSNSQIHTIKIFNKMFTPKSLVIEQGDSVEFEVNINDSS